MKTLWGLSLFLTVFAILSFSSAAQAQATRTWVSGVGDDANPCSRTAPCKTFAGAISKTMAGGEIDALDPGGFGTLMITKSITIDGGGTVSSVLAGGTNGIVIAAQPTDTVTLRNLSLNGAGTGLYGITYTSALNVIVENCAIQRFSSGAINVNAGSGQSLSLSARNLSMTNNGSGVSASGSSSTFVFLFDSLISNSTNASLSTQGATTGSLFVIGNDTIIGNTNLVGNAVQSYGNNRVIGPAIATRPIAFQ